MMNVRGTSLLFALVVVTSIPVLAQEDVLYPWPSRFPFLFGVEIGPNISFFNQTIGHSPIQNPTSPYRALASGNGIGLYGSLIVEYPIGSRFAIRLEEGLDDKRFTMSGTGVADCPNNAGGEFDTVSLDVRQTVTQLWLASRLMLRADIAGGFYAVAGPVLHRRVGDATFDTRQEILTPGDCVFEGTDQKVLEQSEKSDGGINSRRWGIEGGVGYRALLTPSLWLTATLRMQYMLDPLTPDGDVGVDDFRERTLGRLNLVAQDRSLHTAELGVGLMWKP